MPEPIRGVLPAQKKLERPRPQVIQKPDTETYPKALVEQLAQRTEGERIQETWKSLVDYTLLEMEANRLNDGLDTIAALESGTGAPQEKLHSPNFKEAQRLLSEWQTAFPKKDILEMVSDIKTRIRNNLGKEASNLAAAGIELPTGVKFDALEDYISTAPTAELLLRGLQQAMQEHPPATRDRARAEHFLVNEKIRSPEAGIQLITRVMEDKIAILQRLGIQVP